MRFITGSSGEKRELEISQIEEYNENLNSFYEEYHQYLLKKVEIDKIRIRTIICELKLSNEGNIPAEDIDVSLYFPKSLKIIDKENMYSYPEVPDYPENHSFARYTSFPFRTNSLFMPPILPKNFRSPLATKNQEIKNTEKGDVVHLWLKNLKHGHFSQFKTFYCTFPEESKAKSFKITYKITAANLPKQIDGKLNIVI